jgi:hypothetical protein
VDDVISRIIPNIFQHFLAFANILTRGSWSSQQNCQQNRAVLARQSFNLLSMMQRILTVNLEIKLLPFCVVQ